MRTIATCMFLICILFAISAPLTAQTIVSVEPNNAQLGESLAVAIYGSDTHFEDGQDMLIWLSQGAQEIYAYGYYPYSNTELIVWVDIPSDAETGLYDLNVYNDIDGTITFHNGFTIGFGGIVSIHPDNAQQGQQLSVTITGQDTNFQQGSGFSQGSPTIWFSSQGAPMDIYPENMWMVSDILLVAGFDIPLNAYEGVYDVIVENDIDGTLIYYDGFTVTSLNPAITSVTPRGAYQGQNLSVTITGQNTIFQPGTGTFQQGSPTTWFFQGSPTAHTCTAWLSRGSSTIFSNDCWSSEETLLTANFYIPEDANTGLWDVHAPSVGDGVLTLNNSFIIVQPGDWTGDGWVNFFDLAVVAENWLEGTSE